MALLTISMPEFTGGKENEEEWLKTRRKVRSLTGRGG